MDILNLKSLRSIYIFPNGSDVESQSNIVFTLKLERNQHSKDFLVSGKFGLLGRNGKESNSKNIQEQTNKSYKPRNHVNSIMHDKLFDEHKDLIIDGKLTFFCDVSKTLSSTFDPTFSLLSQLTLSSIKGNKILLNPVPNPHEDYKKMFLNELFTDFELKTKDGEPLKVHKAILVARSPVFYAMLQNDMKEARESSAEVSGFDSMVVKELLRFIYYKEVEGLDKIAHDLLLAAEYYQVEELKKLCEATIISSLTVENVLTSLILADRLSATGNLFNECLDVIIRQVSFFTEIAPNFIKIFFISAATLRTSVRLLNGRKLSRNDQSLP